MHEAKIIFIKNYIQRLDDLIEDYNNSEPLLLSQKEDELFDVIIEIRNVLNNEFPHIDDAILLRSGTAIRDANSIIGILKLELVNEGVDLPKEKSDDTLARFWISFMIWFEQELPGNDILYSKYEHWDNWNGGTSYLNIDYEYEFNLHFGISYPESFKTKDYRIEDIKIFIELAYDSWVKLEKRYDFTIAVNQKLRKFKLGYRLQSGKLVLQGYKTDSRIDEILNYPMFERKIQYAEEMISSKELLDKKCALDYIIDSLQYLISVQNEQKIIKKYSCAAKTVSDDINSKKYLVIKTEIDELMKMSNEYFDIRHNEYLNKAREKREVIDDAQFIEYLYNRAFALLYILRLRVDKKKLLSEVIPQ